MSNEECLVCNGLDGSNPLAFLASLGILRTLTSAWPDREVKMRWVQRAGAWRPEISTTLRLSREDCLSALEETLTVDPSAHPLIRVIKSTDQPLAPGNPESYWFTALASDIVPEATSQLQTVRRDYFVGNVNNILSRTKSDHLDRTLFKLWDYADVLDNQSLHFDPTEDRRHAYQWAKPSGDPDRKKRGGMLGANRLAIEAWPFFQAFAKGDRLQTRGFKGTRADNTWWTWPIWEASANSDVLHSLLGMATLQADTPDAKVWRAMGIAAVYRCQRILVGKTPNFTPARAIL